MPSRTRHEACISHNLFRDWTLRLRRTPSMPRRVERDLHDDLFLPHIERETKKLIDEGTAAARARDTARPGLDHYRGAPMHAAPRRARHRVQARFGSTTVAADECRDASAISMAVALPTTHRVQAKQFITQFSPVSIALPSARSWHVAGVGHPLLGQLSPSAIGLRERVVSVLLSSILNRCSESVPRCRWTNLARNLVRLNLPDDELDDLLAMLDTPENVIRRWRPACQGQCSRTCADCHFDQKVTRVPNENPLKVGDNPRD